eukprot:6182807-Pleurochrysis_carterae.AAC.2
MSTSAGCDPSIAAVTDPMRTTTAEAVAAATYANFIAAATSAVAATAAAAAAAAVAAAIAAAVAAAAVVPQQPCPDHFLDEIMVAECVDRERSLMSVCVQLVLLRARHQHWPRKCRWVSMPRCPSKQFHSPPCRTRD